MGIFLCTTENLAVCPILWYRKKEPTRTYYLWQERTFTITTIRNNLVFILNYLLSLRFSTKSLVLRTSVGISIDSQLYLLKTTWHGDKPSRLFKVVIYDVPSISAFDLMASLVLSIRFVIIVIFLSAVPLLCSLCRDV